MSVEMRTIGLENFSHELRDVQEEYLGDGLVLWGRVKNGFSRCWKGATERTSEVAAPILASVLGTSLSVFNAGCATVGSWYLCKEIAPSIIDPDNWNKIGGEMPEWIAEIPTGLGITALVALALMSTQTARQIRSKIEFVPPPSPEDKIRYVEDSAQTLHLATTTGLFRQPFCKAPVELLEQEDRIRVFFEELHHGLEQTRAPGSPLSKSLKFLTGLTCFSTSMGSAWGAVARFGEGFDLGGPVKSYPEGERLIRLGHYQEWFVNTIVFSLTYWIIQDRIDSEGQLETALPLCSKLLRDYLRQGKITPDQYKAIQGYLERELEKLADGCLFEKDPSDYLPGDIKQLKGIQGALNLEIAKKRTNGNIAENVALYLLASAPLLYINYLFIRGFGHEGPEIEEHWNEGYKISHAVGEVAEWAFLFASNVALLGCRLPQHFIMRSRRQALKKVLVPSVMAGLMNKFPTGQEDFQRVLKATVKRVGGQNELQARLQLHEFYPLNQELYEACNGLEGSIVASKWIPRPREALQVALVAGGFFSYVAALASAYGSLMNHIADFHNPGYQGKAAEYWWNCLAFIYSGWRLQQEGAHMDEFRVMQRHAAESLEKLVKKHPAQADEFRKILELTLREAASKSLFPSQPYKIRLSDSLSGEVNVFEQKSSG